MSAKSGSTIAGVARRTSDQSIGNRRPARRGRPEFARSRSEELERGLVAGNCVQCAVAVCNDGVGRLRLPGLERCDHYRVIQSLAYTIGVDTKLVAQLSI